MSRPIFRFAGFRLDIATRELSTDAGPVGVPPRSFDCIAYLIRHRDRAVGRDELVSAVWGRTSVSDTVLGKAILSARRALSDTVDEPRFIRTVSRYGYHWIAPVVDDASAVGNAAEPDAPAHAAAPVVAAAPTVAAAPARRPSLRSRRARVLAGALGAAVLALGAGALALHPASWRSGAPAPTAPAAAAPAPAPTWSAAVLPAAVDARSEDEWLRLGLMDLVAVRLREAGIATMPSEALLRLVHAGDADDAIARRLREAAQVQQVVAPSLRRSGTSWIVALALRRPEGVTVAVEERGVDAIRTAHAAVDRLLERLGQTPSAHAEETPSFEELLQRIEAARLADDLDGVRRLIAAAPPALVARPELRLRLAQVDLRAGRVADARRTLDGLFEVVSAESAPALRAQVLYARGTALLLDGDFAGAGAAYDEGVELAERGADPATAARLYMGRGNLAALRGRYEAAASDHARARVVFQLAGDAFTTFWLDANEGALQNRLGRPAAALPLLARAERHFERFDVYDELVATQANEVVSYLDLARPADALAASGRALPYLERVADASRRRLVLLRRAMALAANGRSAEARATLADLLAAADARDEAATRAAAHALLARLAFDEGRAQLALDEAQHAGEGPVAAEDAHARAAAWRVELDALRSLGREAEAEAGVRAFSRWAAQGGDRVAAQCASLAVAEQASASGATDVAVRAFEAALQQAVALDLPRATIDTAAAYADVLIRAGRTARAIEVAGGVARYADQDYASAALQARLYAALGRRDAEALARERANRLAGERAPSGAVP
ncbi:MAG TPA: winged helix-turn-helix domain-containing protein [Dokdonella sp.]